MEQVINGLRWATLNVGLPGQFANDPRSCYYYKWNATDGWTGYDHKGGVWEISNDPSPSGWRIPTFDEFKKLLDTSRVHNEYIVQNGVHGRIFKDLINGNSIFLPSDGYLESGRVYFLDSYCGYYWSKTHSREYNRDYFGVFMSNGEWLDHKHSASSIRCIRAY